MPPEPNVAPVVEAPPVVEGTPPVTPVVEGTPPVVEGTPPVVEGTPPVVEGTPPGDAFSFLTSPDGWRDSVVTDLGFEGEDVDKYNKMLGRYTNPALLIKSGLSAMERIRKGDVGGTAPDENATDEQIADYRAANDIPATPEKYEISLSEGLVLGEDDTRIMGLVNQAAHSSNIPAPAMNAITNAWLEGRELEADRMVQQDGVHRQQAVDLLKKSWGADMQINTNLVTGLVAGLPEAVRPLFEQGRLEDGRMLMNSPEVLVWFADMARKLNPQAALGINANNGMQAIDDEIKTLKARMGTKEWANDKAAQERYMQLVDGKTAMEKQ